MPRNDLAVVQAREPMFIGIDVRPTGRTWSTKSSLRRKLLDFFNAPGADYMTFEDARLKFGCSTGRLYRTLADMRERGEVATMRVIVKGPGPWPAP